MKERIHKHIILLDFKSKFYNFTLLETLAKYPRRKEKEKKGGGKTGEEPCLCLCLWGKMVVDENEEKGGRKVLYKKKN